ncbi:MAG: polysaccharide biosynthesis protein [Lachnospiraceae bacterium]|nr:polysaccharide biosynthesis protein [Lachnospiraceae bacterium]
MSKNKTNFMVQGSILAIAGILVRIIGVIYRIPLRSIMGPTAMGYYSTAYDVYSLFLLLSSMSLPIAVSKLVSAKYAKKEYKNAWKTFVGAMIFAIIIGLIVSSIMFFGAEKIAELAGYSNSKYALMVLAPTLFVMSVLGVMRGFFQGLGTMVPTAFSQVLEQIANCVLSISAGIYLMKVGMKVGEENSYGAAGVTMGTLVGALTALLFLAFVFILYYGKLRRNIRRDRTRNIESYSYITKILVLTIFPVLLSTTIYNFSNLFDSVIFGNIMKDVLHVAEETYTTKWGIYSSEYRLLTTVPIAIASALSSAVIPSLVKSKNEGNKGAVINKVESAIRFTMIIAIPAGVGLSMLAGPILFVLFPDPVTYNDSVHLMRLAFFTVLVFSFSTITNGILQGIDRMKAPVINASVALAIHLVIIVIALIVFKGGIFGVVISDICYGALVCLFNLRSLRKYLNYRQELLKTFVLPCVAAAIMGIISYGTHHLLMLVLDANLLWTIVAVIVAIIVYFVLLLSLRTVDEAELYMMPMGSKIVMIARKLHLM